MYQEKKARDAEFELMNEKIVDIDDLPVLQDEMDAWYMKYRIIAHGGGNIDGRCYTNSREAWDYSYSRGNRLFDADLNFTSDSVLVLRHCWKDNLEGSYDVPIKDTPSFIDKNGHKQIINDKGVRLNYEMFKAQKIFHLYTPLSCEDMISYMLSHEDLYISTDVHESDIVDVYRFLVEKARMMKAEQILNRIIFNFYDEEDYFKVMSIYPFKNVTARNQYVYPKNFYKLADFCVKHNIHAVNVSQCYINDPGVEALTSKNIHVYVAICDYLSDMEAYHRLGIWGCCSNYLYEDMLCLIENK